MATNAEQELRAMIGDLFMQVAMLRAEAINLKEQMSEPEPKPKGKEEANGKGHHPPQ